AAQHHGTAPSGNYAPRRIPDWHLAGPDAEQRRLATLARASWRISAEAPFTGQKEPFDAFANDVRECRFLNDPLSGTTAKFNCVLNGGVVIKVKYGRNPEIQGEVAGTRLLRTLGFPA